MHTVHIYIYIHCVGSINYKTDTNHKTILTEHRSKDLGLPLEAAQKQTIGAELLKERRSKILGRSTQVYEPVLKQGSGAQLLKEH